MKEVNTCHSCKKPVAANAVVLWDDRRYCRSCVANTSTALLAFVDGGGSLHDTLNRSDIKARHFMSSTGKWVLIVFWPVLAAACFETFRQQNGDPVVAILVLAVLCAGTLVFVCLAAVFYAFSVRCSLPRTVVVAGGNLIVTGRGMEETIPLTECQWYFGATSSDGWSMCTTLRKGVVFRTPDEHFAVGYQSECREHWPAFLVLAKISESPPKGWLWYLAVSSAGGSAGCLVGCVIGYVVSIVTNVQSWIATVGIAGTFDGIVAAVLFKLLEAGTLYRPPHPAAVAGAFFLLATKFAPRGNLSGLIIFGLANALLGLWFTRRCQRRFQVIASEQPVGTAMRQNSTT